MKLWFARKQGIHDFIEFDVSLTLLNEIEQVCLGVNIFDMLEQLNYALRRHLDKHLLLQRLTLEAIDHFPLLAGMENPQFLGHYLDQCFVRLC